MQNTICPKNKEQDIQRKKHQNDQKIQDHRHHSSSTMFVVETDRHRLSITCINQESYKLKIAISKITETPTINKYIC